jgi:flagellar protein FliL
MRIVIMLISLWLVPFFAWANSGSEEKPEEAASSGPVIEYLPMKPKFTINLVEPRKYLLVNVQLMVEGSEAIEKINKNMPALRNALIMLYSGLSLADLQTVEQREALRLKTKDEIRTTLDKFANSDGFRDIFFTEFFIN